MSLLAPPAPVSARRPAAPPAAPVGTVPRLVLRGVSRETYRLLTDTPGNDAVRLAHDPDRDGGRLTVDPAPGRPAAGGWSTHGGEVRFALRHVPPAAFAELREDPRNDHVRMTYARNQGDLLEFLVTISFPHAEVAGLIAGLVDQFCLARDIDHRNSGDMTVSGEGAGSLEGDVSFYIRSYEAVRGKETVDFDAGDPVPDVGVEVVVSNPLANKPALYADLGVGELWVWRDAELTISVLTDDGEYAPAGDSPNLPGFPFALAADVLRRRAELGRTGVLRAFAAGL